MIDQPVVAIVIVPSVGEKFPDSPIVNAPLTLKLDEVVVVPSIVNPEKARVPELLIDPFVNVIVPEDGEKFPDPPTLRECVMAKFEVVDTVPEAATAMSYKDKVPEFEIDEPSLNVAVPAGVVRLVEPLIVRTPPIPKLILVVRVLDVLELVRLLNVVVALPRID